MVQTKFATILLVAAAATIAPVLAAPTATLDLAAREPEIYERAFTFDDASLQTREVDDAMDLVERSFNDALDLNQREVAEGIELEERDFDDELEERSFEDGVELEERGLEDAVDLDAREPILFIDKIRSFFQKKKDKKEDEDDIA